MNNAPQSETSAARPTHEQITVRAELLWKAKGSPFGQDEEIWLEAERQLFDEARETIGTSDSSDSSDQPRSQSELAEEMVSAPAAQPRSTGSGRAPGANARKRSSGAR